MIRLSRALQHTLLYGSSIALMKGVSLLMLPFIATQLSPNAFGRLEVINSLAIIGSIVVGLGLEDALYRFAGAAKTAQQRQRIAGAMFTLAAIIGGMALCLSWFIAAPLANWIPGEPTTYEVRLVLSLLALEGMIAIPLGWLRMREQALLFFATTTGRAILQALLVIALLSMDRGVAGVLEAGLIAAMVQAIVLSYWHLHNAQFGLDSNLAKRTLVYSLPIAASGLLAFALNGLDRWILADHASLNDVAHFGVAAKFALAVVLLLQPFGMWWSPRRFIVLNEHQGPEKTAQFITLGITLTLMITAVVGLASPLLIQWLLPSDYAAAADYVMLFVVIMALKELSELINIGCFAHQTTRAQLIINIITTTVGVCTMLWLAPRYAVWGILWALLLAHGIRLVLFFITSQHYLPLAYPHQALSLILLSGSGWVLLTQLTNSTFLQIASLIVGTLAIFWVAVLLRLIPFSYKLSYPP